MEEAGQRLAQVVDDPQCAKSDVYWSWNGGAQTVGRYSPDGKPRGAGGSGGEIFENSQSDAVRDRKTAMKMWELSAKACGMTERDFPKATMKP
jgi:protochlorophyllide reductase